MEADDGTVEESPFGGDQQNGGGVAGLYKAYRNPNLQQTEFGWEIDPVGFRATIREMDSRYDLPMLVTENGLGAYDKVGEDGRSTIPTASNICAGTLSRSMKRSRTAPRCWATTPGVPLT